MEFVQPIRNKQQLEQMKQYLRRRSERDWFMFEWGSMSGYELATYCGYP